ncbi:hypothetical protein KXX11_000234 [Aspergillus fumigatus]|nr:hypothetical protein KXX11_000234 [Aspergillus fumigatus]
MNNEESYAIPNLKNNHCVYYVSNGSDDADGHGGVDRDAHDHDYDDGGGGDDDGDGDGACDDPHHAPCVPPPGAPENSLVVHHPKHQGDRDSVYVPDSTQTHLPSTFPQGYDPALMTLI